MTTHVRQETRFSSLSGYSAVAAGLVAIGAGIWLLRSGSEFEIGAARLLAGYAAIALGVFVLGGLFMLQPNETAVLTLFGRYMGTDRSEGLRWAFPLYRKRKLTVRARNLTIPILKVNDKRGNPVEIGAAVVWRVRDTAQALFEVDDFSRYVALQAEAALRHLAAHMRMMTAKTCTPTK